MPFTRTVNFDDPVDVAECCIRLRDEHGVKVVNVEEETRSQAQNRFYWKAVIEPLADWMTSTQGQLWTRDDTHEFVKRSFLPLTEHVSPITGEVLLIAKSTTKLTKSDFLCCAKRDSRSSTG